MVHFNPKCRGAFGHIWFVSSHITIELWSPLLYIMFCVCNTWREHMPMLTSYSLSLSSSILLSILEHSFSWYVPQRWLHFNPFFLQEHRKVEQSVLHLHRVMANNLYGAALWSVVIGARELFTVFQPQSSALIPGIVIHFKIWKYAL